MFQQWHSMDGSGAYNAWWQAHAESIQSNCKGFELPEGFSFLDHTCEKASCVLCQSVLRVRSVDWVL